MVELLGGLDAVDAVARATADAAGVTLPEPSTDPGASGTP
jgi:hypothetical protein